MKLQVETSLLAFGVALLVACRLGSSPIVGVSSPPPSATTSQVEDALAPDASAGAAASAQETSPTSASPKTELNPLPVCKQGSSRELAELTLALAAEWDGDDELYLLQADGSDLVRSLSTNPATLNRCGRPTAVGWPTS